MSAQAVVVFGLFAGFAVAVVTAPVGVSGAVFLLPIQLSLLSVPSPAVTPTNLLFNIVSIPGALLRYSRNAELRSPLTRVLLAGTLPGVIAGAVIRVFAIPGVQTFRIVVAAVLLPLGVWLCFRVMGRVRDVSAQPPSTHSIAILAGVVGVIGGIYGIGGGSLISPILVGRGLPVAKVAPAALTSTFCTSLVGAATYAMLAHTTTRADIAPNWTLGLTCGVGGLVGGYIGAHLQPALPEKALGLVLGGLAIATAILYVFQTLS
jgi:uncharacterized membrane protein YfcA